MNAPPPRSAPTLALALLLATSAPLLGQDQAKASEELLRKAQAAAKASMDAIEAWDAKVKTIRSTLETVQKKIDQLHDLDDTLAGKRDYERIRAALKALNPKWEGHLKSADWLRAQLHAQRGTRRYQTANEALHALARQVQRRNERFLSGWRRSRLGTHARILLNGKGRWGRLLNAGASLRERYRKLQSAGGTLDAYRKQLKAVEKVFNPEAQGAYAGLDAIVASVDEVLSRTKAGYVLPYLRFLREAVVAFKGALQRLEQVLAENARQGATTRSLIATQDLHLDKHPVSPPPAELREIKDVPPGVPGRLFRYAIDRNTFALLEGERWVQLHGSLDRVRTVASWLVHVRKVQVARIGELARYVNDYERIFTPRRARFEREIEALYRPLTPPLLSTFLELLGERSSYPDVIAWRRLPGDLFFATWALDPTQHQLMNSLAERISRYALVELTFAPSRSLDPAALRVSIHARGGTTTRVAFERAETKSVLVDVRDASERLEAWVVGASGHVLGRAQVNAVGGERVSLTLGAEPPPETPRANEPASGPASAAEEGRALDADTLAAIAAGKTPERALPEPGAEPKTEPEEGADAADAFPGVDSSKATGSAEDEASEPSLGPDEADPAAVKAVTDALIDAILEGMDTHTGAGEHKHQTHAAFDPKRPGPEAAEFDAFQRALAKGDLRGAAQAYARVTGASAQAANAAASARAEEEREVARFERESKALDRESREPKAPSDRAALARAGVSPAQLQGPVRATRFEGTPADRSLTTSPKPRADTDGRWRAGREKIVADARAALADMNEAARQERVRAQEAVQAWKVPTRGGLAPIHAGGAREVTLRVWDTEAEDGDLVRIVVDGRVIASKLRLTNAGRTYRVALRPGFTSLKVVALYCGDGGGTINTAAMEVRAAGRVLTRSRWQLKLYEVGSTVITSHP